MKNTKLSLTLLVIFSVAFDSCKKNKEGDSVPVGETEFITTLTMTFISYGGNDTAVFQYRDLDSIGGNPPVITEDTLNGGTTYGVEIELLDESVIPPIDVTEEIRDEAEEHQFFFTVSANLNAAIRYSGNNDSNGFPIGLVTAWDGASTIPGPGTFTVTLRHGVDKEADFVSQGNITNAGGETDIEVTFNVVVQ